VCRTEMGLKRVVDISDIPEIPEDQHNLLGLLLIGLLLIGLLLELDRIRSSEYRLLGTIFEWRGGPRALS